MKKTLYVIGGVSRLGKSKVAGKIQELKSLIRLNTDEIRDGIKAIIRYGPKKIQPGDSAEINFSVPIMVGSSNDRKSLNIKLIRDDGDEDSYARESILRMLNFYDDESESDLLIEGVAIKPKFINDLGLKNFVIKGVFLGFGSNPAINDLVIESIINYSVKHKDHFYVQSSGNPKKMREDLKNTIKDYLNGKPELEKLIRESGCEHFDRTEDFEKDVQCIISLLCN